MELIKEIIAADSLAKVVLIFGSNPYLRDQVVKELASLEDISVYGTLNETEGFEMFYELPKVDLILIGQAYSTEQRIRIKRKVKDRMPNSLIAEPGIDFSVAGGGVRQNVKRLLNL
jgi:hypothetical protein